MNEQAHSRFTLIGSSLLATVSALALATPAWAQRDARAVATAQEVVVTARKREETIMQAPVLVQAISPKQIENLHVTKMDSITTVAPGTFIQYSFAQVGITAYLRGLGNSSAATYVDQTIALNIDGFTASTGALFRSAVFDVGQIEVLKGPQSLFFGKSTAAGLIAITSADPTPTWDARATVGYEFKADETDIRGYVSGPITDNLGIRIAGYHRNMKGYLINPLPGVADHRLPSETDDGARVTLKYTNPDLGLRAKLKASYSNIRQRSANSHLGQRICTAAGYTLPSGSDDCKLNTIVSGIPDSLPYSPNFTFSRTDPTQWNTNTGNPLFRDGQPYGYGKAGLVTLNVEKELTSGLTLTSVSAVARIKAVDAFRTTSVLGVQDVATDPKYREWSQEVRLASSWHDSWFNFIAGALAAKQTRRDQLVLSFPNNNLPASLNSFVRAYTADRSRMSTPTKSVFGQVILTPLPKWELDAGLRYTRVTKRWTSLVAINNFGTPQGEQIQNLSDRNRRIKEHATTPEVTLSYKPTDLLTAFVSWKKGYKGPGWNSPVTLTQFTDATMDTRPAVKGETTKGWEGGVKAKLLDRQLNVTLTGYRYNYNDLQVSFFIPQLSTAVLGNGARARVQGVEFSADYSPIELPGLTLNGQLNYNDSYFRSFPGAGCYGAQTAAEGCVTPPGAPASTRVQDLSGRTLSMAPKVVASLGGTYDWRIGSEYKASANAQVQYSSRYYSVPDLNPRGLQKAYSVLNVGVHLARENDAWDLALLCTNCTNKIYVVNGVDGGNGAATVYVARPRQLLLQLTVRPEFF